MLICVYLELISLYAPRIDTWRFAYQSNASLSWVYAYTVLEGRRPRILLTEDGGSRNTSRHNDNHMIIWMGQVLPASSTRRMSLKTRISVLIAPSTSQTLRCKARCAWDCVLHYRPHRSAAASGQLPHSVMLHNALPFLRPNSDEYQHWCSIYHDPMVPDDCEERVDKIFWIKAFTNKQTRSSNIPFLQI